MTETHKGQSETQGKLTLAIPMTNDATYDQALKVFKHIDGQLPRCAEASVFNSTYLNDAAYSCEIRLDDAEPGTGLKLFLGNPDEGFDFAQFYVGENQDEQLDLYGDWDGKVDDVDALCEVLMNMMSRPKCRLFNILGLRPIKIDSIEKVRAYMKVLAYSDLMYHHDDDPWDCLRKVEMSPWERVLIAHYHNKCWEVCNDSGVDIHAIAYEVYEEYSKAVDILHEV